MSVGFPLKSFYDAQNGAGYTKPNNRFAAPDRESGAGYDNFAERERGEMQGSANSGCWTDGSEGVKKDEQRSCHLE
jgi:hypothetical protein